MAPPLAQPPNLRPTPFAGRGLASVSHLVSLLNTTMASFLALYSPPHHTYTHSKACHGPHYKC
ncbi:hypothetical protein E2C01_037717 [Portunus trituberculatus]|uniref:Uncharacterized protein n=1 Tax=Portunus trituberculatus TaxID=210409 RepID=A0A5B7FEU6_PORTR|nr:hypothetical protein [Portunus trituberculatus]